MPRVTLTRCLESDPPWYRISGSGFMHCCDVHAMHYWCVVYEIGENFWTSYKMGLN